uniref:Uncharacterized protein n=1 Tax=Oryza brachyantha TaxID=4533 RepID=J3LBA2_ORYBR
MIKKERFVKASQQKGHFQVHRISKSNKENGPAVVVNQYIGKLIKNCRIDF